MPVGVNIKKFELVSNINIDMGNLLYYGRISSNKGLENALRKFSLLPKAFLFTIAGVGSHAYVKTLMDLCNQLEIEERVSFIGGISNNKLLELLGKAEFVILPSIYEGFGITLIESLAAQKKIIAQNNESYRDILNHLMLTDYLFDFSDNNNLSLMDKIIMLRSFSVKKNNLKEYDINIVSNNIYSYYRK
jgi:glycosyltransferase involved in cell wall biosynthesis